MDRRGFLAGSVSAGLAGCLGIGESTADEDERGDPTAGPEGRPDEEISVTQAIHGYSHWSLSHASEETAVLFYASVQYGPAVTVKVFDTDGAETYFRGEGGTPDPVFEWEGVQEVTKEIGYWDVHTESAGEDRTVASHIIIEGKDSRSSVVTFEAESYR